MWFIQYVLDLWIVEDKLLPYRYLDLKGYFFQIETLPYTDMQTCFHKFWTHIKKTHLLDPKPPNVLWQFADDFSQNKLATCSISVEIWKMFSKIPLQHTTELLSIPAGQFWFLDVAKIAQKLPQSHRIHQSCHICLHSPWKSTKSRQIYHTWSPIGNIKE